MFPKLNYSVLLFFSICLMGLILYVHLAFYLTRKDYTLSIKPLLTRIKSKVNGFGVEEEINEFNNHMKYILWWTAEADGSIILGEKSDPFVKNKCYYTNCFITNDKNYLDNDQSNFLAVIFDAANLNMWRNIIIPEKRNLNQIYIYYNVRPSDEDPVCYERADNLFNWTWTYRVDSDIKNTFIEVLDTEGRVVAPSSKVVWNYTQDFFNPEPIMPINKTKAIATVLRDDECKPKVNKNKYIRKLKHKLKQYNLDLEIYGCGHGCKYDKSCANVVEDYFFYLAYEDNWSQDYVTDEVLKAYDNFAVPVIVGGADYKKFLPEDSYINAQYLSIENLAAVIDYTIKNPSTLSNFHNWRKAYIVQKADNSDKVCELCAKLNSNLTEHKVVNNFRSWWNCYPPKDNCHPRDSESYGDITSFMLDTKKYVPMKRNPYSFIIVKDI